MCGSLPDAEQMQSQLLVLDSLQSSWRFFRRGRRTKALGACSNTAGYGKFTLYKRKTPASTEAGVETYEGRDLRLGDVSATPAVGMDSAAGEQGARALSFALCSSVQSAVCADLITLFTFRYVLESLSLCRLRVYKWCIVSMARQTGYQCTDRNYRSTCTHHRNKFTTFDISHQFLPWRKIKRDPTST